MKLTIDNIQVSENCILIDGITEIGKISGIWKNNLKPIITEYYKNISCISDEYHGMKVDSKNNIVHFYGCCEDMDDEVYYIRLNLDWLEMVDIMDDYMKIKKGDFVSFSAKSDCILIYPY